MKNGLSIILALLLMVNVSCKSYAQTIPTDSLYLGQRSPGNTPVLFAPGIVSLPNRIENTITFSPDGKMCFFSVLGGATYFLEYKNGEWTTPFLENNKFGGEPFFSLDGKRVYLNSKSAQNKVGTCDISYSDKNDSLWTDPISLGSPLNSSKGQWHPCIVADGSIYFSSNNGPICRSQFRNGIYESPVFLLYPINGVSGDTWGDPYVSLDESYIIFRSGRFGNVDIYVSYKKSDGSWTNPKNLGDKINTSGEEFSGDVSPDGKYMFFGRGGNLYWVKTNFIDSLRLTNFIPYVKTQMPAQNATVGSLFSCSVPDSTFIDDDGNNTLTYSASLNDNSGLPSWLQFDSATKTFSGTPAESKSYTIKITVIDNSSVSVSTTFKLTVKELSINYLGQTPPGNTAVKFMTGNPDQPNRLENAGVFSRDGKEFYFSTMQSNWLDRKTYVRKYVNGNWTNEELASFSSLQGGSTETFVTKDNNHIVFPSSDNTLTSDGWIKTDFWITERNGDGWGTPQKLGNAINDIDVQWHPTISDSGHIFFGSRGSIYIADHINDTTFGSPVKLGDVNINKSGSSNADPFVAPDESYLIFSSNRSGGYGNTDLYISYRNTDNTWTAPINLGPNINSAEQEFSSYATPDGKYLLFARDNGSATVRHLYWVNTSFIDSLKQIVTGFDNKDKTLPKEYNLYQNYPNPFNPTTKISYSIPIASQVKLSVFNIIGKIVKTLVNDFQYPGVHSVEWDGTNENGIAVSSGIYLYKLENKDFNICKKMILLR